MLKEQKLAILGQYIDMAWSIDCANGITGWETSRYDRSDIQEKIDDDNVSLYEFSEFLKGV